MNFGLTDEQLAARKNGIGGSDAGKIMSGEWHELWLDKTGRSEPEDLSRVLPVQLGLVTEPLNIHWFERETGHTVFGRGEVYRHPDYDFVRCTLDGVTLIDGKPAVVQCKHVNPFAKLDEIEARYYPQVSHEMLVTGSSLAFLSVFIGTQKWECIEYRRDRDYTSQMLELERQFWHHVTSDTAPPQRDPVAAPAKPATYRTVDMGAHNAWCVHAADWRETTDAAKRNDKAAKELRALVEADVGLAMGAGIEIRRAKDGKALYLRELKA